MALELSPKETALLDALGAAVAAESEEQMPKAFRLNYPADKTDPGYRTWTRTGLTWEEKHPSGRIKRFQTARRAVVGGRPGTVLRLPDDPAFTAFVSDKNADQPQAYWCRGTANWTLLGAMEDVQ